MKKALQLTFFTLFTFLGSVAQIPNAGFEMGFNPDSTMKHWFNNTIYAIGLNDTILYDGPWISLSPDAHSGLLALELRNGFNVTQNQGYPGNVFSNKDSVLGGFAQIAPFPLTGKPHALAFYYKHTQNPFIDTFQCKVQIFNNDLFQIGTGSVKVWDVNNLYQLQTVSVQYIPDSLITLGDSIPAFAKIHLGNIICDTVPHIGQRILVDDLSFLYTPLDVPFTDKESAIVIYPNPAGSTLNIKTQDMPSNTTFEICSVTGQLLSMPQLLSAHNNIDIQNLAKGLYYVKIYTGKEMIVRRFVKE